VKAETKAKPKTKAKPRARKVTPTSKPASQN
jgi:hypothetical protein